jgi:hypothetical protein
MMRLAGGAGKARVTPAVRRVSLARMQVHMFRADRRVFGFTEDGLAANLPTTYGAWVPFKVVVMERGVPMPGVTVDECLDDIDRYGFHLTDAHVRITEQALGA